MASEKITAIIVSVKGLTVLVLPAAAAPAHVISSQLFHISSVPGLLTDLIQ